METKENFIYFESDEEFEDFCVAPYGVIEYSQTGSPFWKGQYSDQYNNAIQKGMRFVIKNEDSTVYKRMCATKRVPIKGTSSVASVQLPVQNLEPYFDDLTLAPRKRRNKGINALKKVEMSYPTWGMISSKLNLNYNAESFGKNPLTCDNISCYTTIKNSETVPCGIDIPVLLKPQKEIDNGKVILIIGESPLRSNDEINNCPSSKNAIIGLPYAIHLPIGYPRQCNVYKMIFNCLLEEGYSVYITDIIKVWRKGKELNPDKLDIEIFQMELDLFDNPLIVAWGKRSADVLEKRFKKKPNDDFLPFPHPSPQNWNNWKLKIFEKAVYDNNVEYATKLYKHKGDSTTPDIVANEAVKDIVEFIDKLKTQNLTFV